MDLPSLLLVIFLVTSPALAQDFDTRAKVVTPAPEAAARTEAAAALDAGNFPRALKLLTALAAANPADPAILYDLASAQDALDQASAAEVSYRAAIAASPSSVKPHVALGLLLARQGKLVPARAELTAAITIPAAEQAGDHADDPLRARAYRALAHIDQRTRPTEARDELLAALKLSPESADDTLLAAELAAAATGGAPAAEATYRRLLATHPADPDATAGLAHILLQSDRAPEAETLLQAALTAHPQDPSLTVQLASALAAQSKSVEAIPLLTSLPHDPNVDRLLATLYIDSRQYAPAEPLLAQLCTLNPQDPNLADEHADALVHLKRFAEAEQTLTRVVAQPALWTTPEDRARAAGRLAFAASENNDPAGALRALDVRATVLPPSAPTLFLAAISYDKLHKVKQAQQAYQQFLAASNGQNPDEEFEAKHRLVALEHTK